ncbi:hypothetical protein ACIP98_28815 [Streptomyces sp. NPDC088354]|uniref:hypothetical protein n=1 Tax=Streptomyces sp. NPDC088354 TaxID=3365856 RepID=UPI0037FB5945
MAAAVRLDPEGSFEAFDLPADYTRQRLVLRGLLGGAVDGAVYHRRALIHVHGEGALSLGRELNVAAWALAGIWRGAQLPYGLYGTAVVTGPNLGDGSSVELDDDLAEQVRAVCGAVSDMVRVWRTRPPACEATARAEVLAAARAAAGAVRAAAFSKDHG